MSPFPPIHLEAVIVGAGPAGLAAAEVLARAGHPPVIYDAMPSVGRKFLLAGRGGLNLTHSEALDRFLTRYGPAQAALEPIVRAFPPADLVTWSEGLEQPVFTGTSGRVFPIAMKASPLLRAWLRRLESQGVRVVTRRRWTGFTPEGDLVFAVPGAAQEIVRADATILALGGASWPRLGSDGGWVPILREVGVAVRDLTPANCGVRVSWSGIFRERFAGVPLKRIALSLGDRQVRGEAMITESGLEGGAVYALGPAIREALSREGAAIVSCDLRPDVTEAALAQRLGQPRGGASLSNVLRKAAGLSPAGIGLLREADGGKLPTDGAALAALIKAVPIRIEGLAGIERAISSAGGVPFSELSEDLEIRAKPGLFVAGEMIDWDAPTGGYLLQACFATGAAAGRGALARLAAAPQSSKS